MLVGIYGRLGASPCRTNRKSRSPVIHIATANSYQAAKNCCQVNAGNADFGLEGWCGFVK